MKIGDFINTDEGAVRATPNILPTIFYLEKIMSTITYTPQELDPFAEHKSGPFHDEFRRWVLNSMLTEELPEPVETNSCFGSIAGPNHPSRLWHKEERPDDFAENCRECAIKQWQGEKGEARKKLFSNNMKDRWQSEEREKLVTQSRKNGNHGLAGKDVGALEIEYCGKTYWGWNELMRETGVSKHLYKKYYMNGINPEYRIGKNGPEAL